MIVPTPRRLDHGPNPGVPLGARLAVGHDAALGPEAYVLDTTGGAGEGEAGDTSDDGSPSGAPRVMLRAGGPAGEAYGRASLAQLARHAVDGRYPAVRVSDAPRFAHRGLMLDVARHVHPVATILEAIDLMASLKLNVLHLHLTDDQGWRIETPSRPRLTQVGALTQVGGGGGGYLTQADYRAIQDHARAAHVLVIPEIDLPGHVNAALVAYPELAPAGVTPEPYEGIEVGFSGLDAANPETERFLEDVLGDLAAATDGPYLHLGGDECLAMSDADYLALVALAARIVTAHGKRVVGWHEIGRSPQLPPGTLGQYWNFVTPRTADADEHGIDHAGRAASIVAQGGRLVMSPGDAVYLDHKYDDHTALGLVWDNGPTTLRDSYAWDPTLVVPGVGEDAIAGVEATCFTETIVTREDLFRMLLPRLAAVAEVAWSPRPDAARDVADLERRLPVLALAWREAGLPYERLDGVAWQAEPGDPAGPAV
ncbi:MAG TPA: beta-N-acetylhexosaminidase [Micrococcales bacterium]|nr:beta-N-acetylhexosaminidase [Micrococcales bacterium]